MSFFRDKFLHNCLYSNIAIFNIPCFFKPIKSGFSSIQSTEIEGSSKLTTYALKIACSLVSQHFHFLNLTFTLWNHICFRGACVIMQKYIIYFTLFFPGLKMDGKVRLTVKWMALLKCLRQHKFVRVEVIFVVFVCLFVLPASLCFSFLVNITIVCWGHASTVNAPWDSFLHLVSILN